MRILLILFALGLVGCGSSRQPKFSDAELQNLGNLIDNNWEIQSNWASPLATTSFMAVANSGLLPPGNNANMINLIGNPNYVRKKGDTVSIYLPYFGERRIGGSYGGRGSAIEFEGVPKVFEINKNDKKQRYDIRMVVNDKENTAETYTITIRTFPNKNSNINVNSSQRTTISYAGLIQPIDTENQ